MVAPTRPDHARHGNVSSVVFVPKLLLTCSNG